MPQRTNAFQRIVTLLTATLAGQSTVEESALVQDKVTHELREVDILISTQAANYSMTIGIEVVAWSRRAGTPWVEKMRAKHANLEIDKLVLVSQSGFSKPALKKASFYNIECLTVEAACKTDWPKVAKLQSEGVFQLTNFKFECSFICESQDGSREKIEAPLDTTISTTAGTITLSDFVRSIIHRPEFKEAIYPHIESSSEQDFWFSYTEPGGLWQFEKEESFVQVQELRVTIKVLQCETPIQYGSGKFKKTPFVAGVSTSGVKPLQFVLVKTPEGKVTGYVVDEDGTRALASDDSH
ncbi:MAG: hypothetical protein V2I38_05230 [Alcanivoracaceae bacterium]|jgi:hypothetical protein|nr:hypothetical protein [Alcanivoracaceae bacterium]